MLNVEGTECACGGTRVILQPTLWVSRSQRLNR